jgi:hypothetical protein
LNLHLYSHYPFFDYYQYYYFEIDY